VPSATQISVQSLSRQTVIPATVEVPVSAPLDSVGRQGGIVKKVEIRSIDGRPGINGWGQRKTVEIPVTGSVTRGISTRTSILVRVGTQATALAGGAPYYNAAPSGDLFVTVYQLPTAPAFAYENMMGLKSSIRIPVTYGIVLLNSINTAVEVEVQNASRESTLKTSITFQVKNARATKQVKNARIEVPIYGTPYSIHRALQFQVLYNAVETIRLDIGANPTSLIGAPPSGWAITSDSLKIRGKVTFLTSKTFIATMSNGQNYQITLIPYPYITLNKV